MGQGGVVGQRGKGAAEQGGTGRGGVEQAWRGGAGRGFVVGGVAQWGRV